MDDSSDRTARPIPGPPPTNPLQVPTGSDLHDADADTDAVTATATANLLDPNQHEANVTGTRYVTSRSVMPAHCPLPLALAAVGPRPFPRNSSTKSFFLT
jgi:hypothetical protein